MAVCFERRAAGMAQAQQLGDLVEGLAQRIVDGGAPALIIADAAHQHELAMAARNQQHQIGKGDTVGQPRRQRMGFEVIDGDQRLAERGGQRLGGGQPDQHAPDQAGAGRGGDGIDIAQRDAGLAAGLGDDVVEIAHMGARRQFGHDAAKGGVFIQLRAHDIGNDHAPAGIVAHNDGRGGFVAAGLDAQYGGLRLPDHDELVYSEW